MTRHRGGRDSIRVTLKYAWPHRSRIGGVLGLMLAGIALDALKPWPMKLIVDNVITRRSLPSEWSWVRRLPGAGGVHGLAAWLALATVLLAVLTAATQVVVRYVQTSVGTRISYDIARDVFDHVQRLSLRYHTGRAAGDTVRRITTDTGFASSVLTGVLFPIFGSLVSLAVMLVIMWRLDGLLALLSLSVAFPLGVTIAVFAGPMARREYTHQQLESEIMALAEQTLTSIPVVQAFGREAHHDGRFFTLSNRTARAAVRSTVSQLRFKVASSAVTAFGTAGIMAVGGVHVLRGRLSLGSLLIFLSYLASLYAPLETLAYVSSAIASASASGRRVMETLAAAPDVIDRPGAVALPRRVRGDVRFESVSFAYKASRPTLQAVSLEALPGERIALVGQTGAGKSTIVSLICRFYDPDTGRVMIDGHDLRDVTIESVRSQISLVLQDALLLPISVADNIAYGRPGASPSDIRAAGVAANADEFIMRLPDRYQTVLGQRGTTLSGGERQRLAIARALLKDAPILILDEPTSALDAETEASLLDALRRLIEGRTTFIVAHRFSTIREADKVAVIEDGRVVEWGPYDRLVRSGGPFQRLLALQRGTRVPANTAGRRREKQL